MNIAKILELKGNIQNMLTAGNGAAGGRSGEVGIKAIKSV